MSQYNLWYKNTENFKEEGICTRMQFEPLTASFKTEAAEVIITYFYNDQRAPDQRCTDIANARVLYADAIANDCMFKREGEA